MTLSIVIVNYNVREFLEQALVSVQKAVRHIDCEIWVVDNASSDGSAAFIRRKFPDVKLIANEQNLGFARANNQALQQATGKYICLLNPDTIVQENTFDVLLRYMEDHPEVGMVGAKILNADGSLQLACRRSFPTPWVAFTKIVGLAALFPKSRWFGRYNLTFLDPEQEADVEAISGSFMFVRRSVIEQVGGLDEDFFMYGEDLDWCYRIREAGYRIRYVPYTQIIHFKGESSKKSLLQQRLLFYEAMRLFVRKHFKKRIAWIPLWGLLMAIYLRAALSFIGALFRKAAWPLFDAAVMALSLAAAVLWRFFPSFPWQPFLPVYLIYSIVWITALGAYGCYSRHHLSAAKASSGVLLGWLINTSITFFLRQYAFSRAVVLLSGGINLLLLPGWRMMLNFLLRHRVSFLSKLFGKYLLERRSLVVGDAQACAQIIRRLRNSGSGRYEATGVVLIENDPSVETIDGVSVVGFLPDLPEIIRRERAHEVIFAAEALPYEKMLAAIARSKGLQISFKMVPSQLDVVIGKATLDYLEDIPFIDIDYRLYKKSFQFIKRSFDILAAGVLLTAGFPAFCRLRWIRKTPLVSMPIKNGRNRTASAQVFASDSFWHIYPLLPAVLRGEMSIVGRSFNNGYEIETALLKPGIAALDDLPSPAISNDEERKRFIIYYLKNYSPFLDLKILFMTAKLRKKRP
ncbi:MAG: glycosyltransferase [candidate division KSB1 bacterium]|nr:glycosyltransferase [candidate division KSB1 bacterium]